jgi:hypothetical protein
MHRRNGMIRTLVATVVLAEALVASTARGDVTVNVNVGPPPPIVLAAPPPLVVVPGVPVVQYAPSVGVDLFFVSGQWYYWHGGNWFVGRSYRGPWTYVVVERVPRPLFQVPVAYYKVPPGHLQGGGPPGHAKGKGHN